MRLGVAVLAALSGCAASGDGIAPRFTDAQPVVDVTPVTQDFSFARSGPTPLDVHRLSASLRQFVGGRTDALHVALPVGPKQGTLVSDLVLMGVLPRKISRSAAIPAGTLRATRYVATVAPCPPLDLAGGAFGDNLSQPGFGCAVTADYAAQVADPADLIGSDADQPADPERAAVPVQHWRSSVGEPSTASGSLSTTGSSTSGGGPSSPSH